MTDVYDKKTRSKVMQAVRSKNNKSTELSLLQFFKEEGIKGWRRTYKLPGKPDFVFPIQKIVIFTDGCFWHGHDCRNTKPSQNKEYWDKKRERNVQRDKLITQTLTEKNWMVVRIWECDIKKGTFKKKLIASLKTGIF